MIKKFGWLLSCVFVWVSFNCWAKSKEITVATEADDVVTRVLFDAIAEQFALDVTYVNMPSFDAILDSVARGETDFAANITFTHEREKDSVIHTQPTLNIPISILIRPIRCVMRHVLAYLKIPFMGS